MKMTGNTILVTGGTSGIGRALAEAFHARGNRVIIAGRRRQLLDEIAAAHPGMVGIEVDVESAASREAFAARVASDHPDANVFFNNAGIMWPDKLTPGDDDRRSWRTTIETNIVAVLHLAEILLPTLARNADAAIVTTTSGLAFVPRGDFPAYSASKAFLHSWIQSQRHQLRDTGVEVLELTPPYVQTELTGAHQATDPRAMPLSDFIAEVLAILEDGRTANGEILVERVMRQRLAERNGIYDELYRMLNPT